MFRLKSLARALCLATGLLASAGAANASLSVTGGAATPLAGLPGTFNPAWFGDASLYASSFDLSSMLQGASLMLTRPASVTYTLVGFEAAFNNAFVAGSERLDNRSGALSNLGDSFSMGTMAAAPLDFSFLSNGINSLFGNGNVNTGVVMSADQTSALILFNDSFNGDGDFDDMVVRVSVSAVPEPEMLGMLLLGLGVVTAAVRRRSRALVSA